MKKGANLVKSIVKKAAPKATFGTNPSDPWSAKANISETALLNKYLFSRGINPQFLSKDALVSHAKTDAFKKWARDHQTEEVQHEETQHLKNKAGPGAAAGKTAERASALKQASRDYKEIKTPRGDLKREDVYSDPLAATQMPFDGANNPYDTSPRQKGMSKSARIIKAIYKLHKMKAPSLKEDLYDQEKEDKSVATYGKKPKMDTADKKDSMGENKPKAAAVLSGGTTLTGQKRDTIEIDPMMRVRPGQPDPTKKDEKKGGKEEEKKKDK